MEKGNAVVTTVSGAADGAAGRAVDVVVEVASDAAGTVRDKVVDKGADAAIESTGRRLRDRRDASPAEDAAHPGAPGAQE